MKYITKQKVLEIIKICEENSISYNVYTDKTILATSLKYNVLYYYKENLKKEENKKTNINIVKDMYEYVKEMKEDKFFKNHYEEFEILLNWLKKGEKTCYTKWNYKKAHLKELKVEQKLWNLDYMMKKKQDKHWWSNRIF